MTTPLSTRRSPALARAGPRRRLVTRVLAPSARPFLTYEIPPEHRQITTSPAARDAFRDVIAFAERCTKWLGSDRP
jgi:hypothetical protein